MASQYSTPQAPLMGPHGMPIATPPAPGAFPMPHPGGHPLAQPGQYPMPQPGIPMQPQGGWPQPNTICPPGLEYLMALDHLFVRQKVDLVEALLGWETNIRYTVLNIREEPVFYVVEDSGICARYCFSSERPCEFHVYDASRREVLRMVRPFRCNSCCCPCCPQEIEVYSGDTLLGTVVADWSLWRPCFSVRNASGDTVLTIKGPLVRFCVESTFKVKSADGEHRVGDIKKKWHGLGRELFTNADLFGVSFPGDLDVKIKAVLLGACFLIDLMYFEGGVK